MIELHRKLLGDAVRNRAFHDALQKTVRPGVTLLDVGAGTGFLSFIASRMGAKCHLVEQENIITLARSIGDLNGIKNCTYRHEHSTKASYKGKVDIIVSETLGNYAFEENIIESIESVRHMLKPGGVIMPSSLRQFIAPVITPRLYDGINIWDTIGYDLDMSPAKAMSLNNMYVKTVLPDDIGGESNARQWDAVDFYKKSKSVRNGNIRWSLKSGTVYGFALWWESTLAEGVTLSTSPFAPLTHWEQIYLPLVTPVTLKRPSVIEATLLSDSRFSVGIDLSWTLRVFEGEKQTAEQAMSMEQGMYPRT
ncbi:MAG: methyltransferase domain-containing protein [Spirochaetes bacterium]|nr:methyltransferase domain-containing protein [Spirochaetota bacterium]